MINKLFAQWRGWRAQRVLERRPIPDDLWALTVARFPFLHQGLTDDERIRLRALTTLFLATKEFSGANGLHVTDDMAVAVAAQACLPVLNLGLTWYDDFVGIVIHPGEVIAHRQELDEDGVMHHFEEVLSGEAMEGGPITLSWQDVADAAETAAWGYNVVIHEFAHVLDMRDGRADGAPPLPNREARAQWHHTLDTAYNELCQALDNGQETVLDPYATEGPEEMFAVACEAFFVSGADMSRAHPALYAQLRDFFGQDPARRTG